MSGQCCGGCGAGAELICLPETTLQIAAPDPFPAPAPFFLTTDLKKLYKKIKKSVA